MDSSARLPPVRTRAPLLFPALAFTGGVALGGAGLRLSIPLAFILGALGLLPRHRAWRLLGWIVSGWILAHLCNEPWEDVVSESVLRRPVTLTGRIEGCWERTDRYHRARFVVRRIEQGGSVWLVDRTIRLYAADRGEHPSCGGRIRVRGYLRPPRWFHNRPRVRVGGWGLFLESPRLSEILEAPGPFAGISGRIRRHLFPNGSFEEGRGRGRALARALLTGDTGELPREWVLGLQRAGLSHVLAVSGLHVGLLLVLTGAISLPLPRSLRFAALLSVLIGYGLVVGPRSSLLRAGCMGAVGSSALFLRRPPQATNALSIALLGLLSLAPERIQGPGFQLSVAATAGILFLYRPLTGMLEPVPDWVRGPFAVTLAAQIATIPWSLSLFHRWPLMAPVLNLLAVPWLAAALFVAVIWAGLRIVLPGIAAPVVHLLDLLAAPLSVVADLSPDLLRTEVVSWAWAPALVLVGAIWAAVWLGSRPGARKPLLALGLVVSIGAWGWDQSSSTAPATPELLLLDVGQGEGMVLRDGREAIVIDAGGWDGPGFGVRVVAPVLAREGLDAPRALVVTHGDRDHCGGILDLARLLQGTEVWLPPGLSKTPCGQELLQMVWLEHRTLRAGDRAKVGRWRLTVLGPGVREGGRSEGRNTDSLVLAARIFDRSLLLTGDIDAAAERRLARSRFHHWIDSDLLKVAHHGSRTSTTEDWLDLVTPRRALISAGAHNAYGHPAPAVLTRLVRRKILVLRTDRQGMIRLRWPAPGPPRIRVLGRGN